VQAAFDAFLADGYYETSLRAIAARIGITHAGLLHHFRSKDELLREVLARWDQDTRQWIDDALPEVHSFDDFIELISKVLVRHRDEPAMIQLLVSLTAEAGRSDHPAHEHFRARYDLGREFLVRYIRPLQKLRQIDAGADPVEMANTIMAAMDGLQLQWLLDQDVDSVGTLNRLLDRYRPASAARSKR
jgi:AcrR family transcriptional regulator